MTCTRRPLAWLLAAMLLLQWGGIPSQTVALASLEAAIDAAICTPPGHQAPDHKAPWTEQLCLAAHALDATALLPAQPASTPPTLWLQSATPQALRVAVLPPARAPPHQPRAPPSLT